MGGHFMFVPDYKGMEHQVNFILQDQKVPKECLPKKLIPQGEISPSDPDRRMHMPLLLEWLLSFQAYSYMYTMHAKTAGGVVSSSCHDPYKRGTTIQKKYPGQTEVIYPLEANVSVKNHGSLHNYFHLEWRPGAYNLVRSNPPFPLDPGA